MKNFISVLVVTYCAALSAADCKLTTPFHIGAKDLLLDKLVLHEAKFNVAPKFNLYEGGDYDPATDKLEVSLFNVKWESHLMNYLGSSVSVEKKSGWVGFPADGFIGTFNISGETGYVGNVTNYHTKEVTKYTEPQHAKNDAVTENYIAVDNGYLTSLRLIAPVFKVWKEEHGVKYLAFTGEHQDLCLLEAK